MQNEINNLSVFKIIRVAKGITLKELSKYFDCDSAYLSECANGKKKINLERLKRSLANMNIRTSEYFVLEEMRDYMIKNNYSYLEIYQTMLIYALGMVNPELKEEASDIVEQILHKDVKHK